MDLSMRLGLSFFALSTILGLALAAPAMGSTSFLEADDGTYRTVPVRSAAECATLCKSDHPNCRGTITVQMDTRKPDMICRLNDGTGSQPAFPSIPPEPLDMNVALSDFNTYRARKGLLPVRLNTKLNRASQIHAEDMAFAGDASHTGTDGSSHSDRVQRQAYYFSIAAENVASGQKSWDKVFEAWQKSPGHNANLLLEDITDFGVALVYDPNSAYQTYWAMLVASPLDARTQEVMRVQGELP